MSWKILLRRFANNVFLQLIDVGSMLKQFLTYLPVQGSLWNSDSAQCWGSTTSLLVGRPPACFPNPPSQPPGCAHLPPCSPQHNGLGSREYNMASMVQFSGILLYVENIWYIGDSLTLWRNLSLVILNFILLILNRQVASSEAAVSRS